MNMIEVAEVSKTFYVPRVRRDTLREHVFDLFRAGRTDELRVLRGVSLSIDRGETVAIVGRNGSGKSTLLKIIANIFPPDAGRVVTRGSVTPILELGVGWNPELDAIDNSLLIGSVMGLSLAEIRGAIDEILAFAELEQFADMKLKYYSSGMGARLAYSIAFKAVREILILDEIFAVGDASFQARCKERYRELKAAGHTVLLVSHDDTIVRGFCDRAVLLDQGRIVMDAAPNGVCDAYAQMGRESALIQDQESAKRRHG